jgi:hypothetical protein
MYERLTACRTLAFNNSGAQRDCGRLGYTNRETSGIRILGLEPPDQFQKGRQILSGPVNERLHC